MSASFIDSVSFQFFPARIWDATPLGELTLRQFLDVHREPKESTVKVIEEIKEAAKNNDLKLKDSLKQNNLYSFVPSVKLDGVGRAYSNVIDYNPVMICEFDKIDHAKELKERLFNNLKCVIAAWISPSGKGLKLLIRIEKPTSIDNYKEYYCGLAYYLSQYEGFDPANFNCCLPLFLSYDRDIFVREDAEVWTQRGGKINAFQNYICEIEPNEEITVENTEKVVTKITFLMNRIIDNAHTQLLSISTLLGGWVGFNLISLEDAEALICELIENNDYMKKNINGYCKTARDMIRRGILSPIPIDNV
jgi:hypothetical protein